MSYLQLRTYSPAAKLAGISTLSTISRLFGPSNHAIVQSQAISQISEAIVQSQTISQISEEGDILVRSVAVGGWVGGLCTYTRRSKDMSASRVYLPHEHRVVE